MKKIISFFVLCAFVVSCIMPPHGFAQSITALGLMPEPGVMVGVSEAYQPARLKAMSMDLQDPLKFDFIIDRGDEELAPQEKQEQYTKLVKYFLAALAVPDTDQWVNLSPYEQDRIIPDNFGLTEMGRDLLAQDYLMKQVASSLTNPDTDLGKAFWDGVYAKVHEKFGSAAVPADVFNKVWVVPSKAVIHESGNRVYVISSHLKVMLDRDYLAARSNGADASSLQEGDMADISAQMMREVIIPAIEKEINEGRAFAPVRQIYSAMLLATWYKDALRQSFLGRLYADQGKVKGIDQDPAMNQQIYARYVEAFRKGVFNMIREDADRLTNEVIPRKYFSGGDVGWGLGVQNGETVIDKVPAAEAGADLNENAVNFDALSVKFEEPEAKTDEAQRLIEVKASDLTDEDKKELLEGQLFATAGSGWVRDFGTSAITDKGVILNAGEWQVERVASNNELPNRLISVSKLTSEGVRAIEVRVDPNTWAALARQVQPAAAWDLVQELLAAAIDGKPLQGAVWDHKDHAERVGFWQMITLGAIIFLAFAAARPVIAQDIPPADQLQVEPLSVGVPDTDSIFMFRNGFGQVFINKGDAFDIKPYTIKSYTDGQDRTAVKLRVIEINQRVFPDFYIFVEFIDENGNVIMDGDEPATVAMSFKWGQKIPRFMTRNLNNGSEAINDSTLMFITSFGQVFVKKGDVFDMEPETNGMGQTAFKFRIADVERKFFPEYLLTIEYLDANGQVILGEDGDPLQDKIYRGYGTKLPKFMIKRVKQVDVGNGQQLVLGQKCWFQRDGRRPVKVIVDRIEELRDGSGTYAVRLKDRIGLDPERGNWANWHVVVIKKGTLPEGVIIKDWAESVRYDDSKLAEEYSEVLKQINTKMDQDRKDKIGRPILPGTETDIALDLQKNSMDVVAAIAGFIDGLTLPGGEAPMVVVKQELFRMFVNRAAAPTSWGVFTPMAVLEAKLGDEGIAELKMITGSDLPYNYVITHLKKIIPNFDNAEQNGTPGDDQIKAVDPLAFENGSNSYRDGIIKGLNQLKTISPSEQAIIGQSISELLKGRPGEQTDAAMMVEFKDLLDVLQQISLDKMDEFLESEREEWPDEVRQAFRELVVLVQGFSADDEAKFLEVLKSKGFHQKDFVRAVDRINAISSTTAWDAILKFGAFMGTASASSVAFTNLLQAVELLDSPSGSSQFYGVIMLFSVFGTLVAAYYSMTLVTELPVVNKFFGSKTGSVDNSELGGISMSRASLDLQIKRDGNGLVLPVDQQDLENIRINGLVPVVLRIGPASVDFLK